MNDFISTILVDLKDLENNETDPEKRSKLANIIGRLGTFNEMYAWHT